MENKTRLSCTPITMAKSGTLTISNAGEDVEQQELSFITSGDAKWDSHFGRQFDSFFPKSPYSPYNPTVMLPAICSRELKTGLHKM